MRKTKKRILKKIFTICRSKKKKTRDGIDPKRSEDLVVNEKLKREREGNRGKLLKHSL